MTKPTKKDLRAALTPLRKQAERYARGLLTGGRSAPRHEPITWRGLSIDVEIVRRSQVVCNVPAPYFAFELWYRARRGDELVCTGLNGANLIDNLFILHHRGEIVL